jgi:hypothetical protein
MGLQMNKVLLTARDLKRLFDFPLPDDLACGAKKSTHTTPLNLGRRRKDEEMDPSNNPEIRTKMMLCHY